MLFANAFRFHILSALLVAPNMFLIPYLLGSSISSIFLKELRYKRKSFEFLIGFLVGSLFLHLLFVVTEFFGFKIDMFLFDVAIIFIISLGFAPDLVYRFSKKGALIKDVRNKLKISKINLVFPLLIALVAFCIPKIAIPFPLTSLDGGVGHEILKPVTRLLSEGILDVYRARGLPVIFESVVSSFSNVPVLNLNWAAPLATCALFAFSVYFLVNSITKKRTVALAATMLAFFLNGSGLSFDTVNYIFRYSTILSAIFPLVILEVYLHFVESKKQEKRTRTSVILLFGITISEVALLWGFEFLKPDFLVALFGVNEFLRPFVYVSFLTVSFLYVSILKNIALRGLVILLAFFASFAIALDILIPVFFILFLYLFVLILEQVDFQNVKPSAEQLIEKDAWLQNFKTIFFGSPVKMMFLRVVGTVLVIFLFGLITGYFRIEQLPSPFWASQDTMLSKSASLIVSNSMEVLIISLLVALFLLYSSHVEDFVFSSLFIAGLSIYFLPFFDLFKIAYQFVNVFMAITLALGTFRILETLIVANKHNRNSKK